MVCTEVSRGNASRRACREVKSTVNHTVQYTPSAVVDVQVSFRLYFVTVICSTCTGVLQTVFCNRHL
jgi:hypothetical protein